MPYPPLHHAEPIPRGLQHDRSEWHSRTRPVLSTPVRRHGQIRPVRPPLPQPLFAAHKPSSSCDSHCNCNWTHNRHQNQNRTCSWNWIWYCRCEIQAGFMNMTLKPTPNPNPRPLFLLPRGSRANHLRTGILPPPTHPPTHIPICTPETSSAGVHTLTLTRTLTLLPDPRFLLGHRLRLQQSTGMLP